MHSFSNRLSSIDGIDKSKLIFNVYEGLLAEYHLLKDIIHIIKNGHKEQIAFQCLCGALSIAELVDTEKMTGPDNNLLCHKCAKYQISIRVPLEGDALLHNGIIQLSSQLALARSHCYPELIWFSWSSLSLNREQIIAIDRTTTLLYDNFFKNEMEFFLEENGLSQFYVGRLCHHDRQTVLLLTLLTHLIELSPFYDLFLSILQIADNQYTFFNVADHSFQNNIGCKITNQNQQTGEKDAPITQKKHAVKEFLDFKKLEDVLKLFERSFDVKLRNDFVHAEYKIKIDGIEIPRREKSLSYEELKQKTFGAFYIVTGIIKFIEEIREDFIKNGSYIGDGYKIIPITQNNKYSIRVEF